MMAGINFIHFNSVKINKKWKCPLTVVSGGQLIAMKS